MQIQIQLSDDTLTAIATEFILAKSFGATTADNLEDYISECVNAFFNHHYPARA